MDQDLDKERIEKILKKRPPKRLKGRTTNNTNTVKKHANNIKEWIKDGYSLKEIFLALQKAGERTGDYTEHNFGRTYARTQKNTTHHDTGKSIPQAAQKQKNAGLTVTDLPEQNDSVPESSADKTGVSPVRKKDFNEEILEQRRRRKEREARELEERKAKGESFIPRTIPDGDGGFIITDEYLRDHSKPREEGEIQDGE